ncbi:MAG: hypothetical protein ACI9BW_001245 [Gammaproteobacteria bacterium]|jgi:hypothetical protein
MSEEQVIGSLMAISDQTATYVNVWISLTFGYLTVSYFLGKALSRFQCLAISCLYVVLAFLAASSAYGLTQSWFVLLDREKSLLSDVWIFRHGGREEGLGIVFVVATLVALYFMYNVRRSN